MRASDRLLLSASLALLIIAFTAYQRASTTFSSVPAAMPGASPVYELIVNVQVVGVDGVERPDPEALVTVGLHSVRTGSDGVARLKIAPGKYSAFVKSGDSRLLPLTLELAVEGNTSLNVQFRLVRLYPDGIELESGAGSTEIRMHLTAPEGGRLFISYPQITGLTPSGSPIRMARGPDGFSNFFQRISPGPLTLDLSVEQEIAAIDVNSTYVPLQIIDWEISA